MKRLYMLFCFFSLMSFHASATDIAIPNIHTLISECKADGNNVLRMWQEIEESTGRKGILVNDDSVAEIRKAQAECAARPPAERPESGEMPPSMQPGGILNPIYIQVLPSK